MRSNYLKTLKTAVLAVCILLLGVSVSVAQQTINLTAGPTTVTLPDGTVVPMWGYTCTVTGTALATGAQTCGPLNPSAPAAVGTTPAGWSPVFITVPYVSTGTSLTISLTNNLTFTAGTGANSVPTSLMIVGQVGGGLGTAGATCLDPVTGVNHGSTCTTSPGHASQTVTWSTTTSTPGFTPPPQGPRVQSFGTEVPVGTPATLTWSNLKPGTYLLESGTHPSIQVPMGLYGVLVVSNAPTAAARGCAYWLAGATPTCQVPYDAEVPQVLGEIDPVQNKTVQAAVTTAGFNETAVWSGQPGGCGDPTPTNATYHTCYPPAVNYTPLYYLINGVAFNKTGAAPSLFAAATGTTTSAPATGTVLVRFVNAGLRMHVPSILGSTTPGSTYAVSTTGVTATPAAVSGFALIAEDGNVLPDVALAAANSKPLGAKVQTDVFLAAGKVYDVLINVPAVPTGATLPPALPVYDRELSLSGNKISRDNGMLGYIGVNGAVLPTSSALAAAVARADTYNSVVAGQTLVLSDPSKGVLANDTNVYGAQISGTAPTGLTLNTDGTFTYSGGVATTFTYCGNGTTAGTTGAVCATVTLGLCGTDTTCTSETSANINAYGRRYTSTLATYLAVKTPGVLGTPGDQSGNPSDSDGAGYPLTVNVPTTAVTLTGPGTGTVLLDANGGFTASVSAAGTYTFTYQAKNAQGILSAAQAVTLIFPTPSGLAVTVLDGTTKAALAGQDYRWIIEEDQTFYIDPKCTSNPPPAGCPTVSIPGQGVAGIVPTLGVNFHTSHMPFVAQGCTGPVSCEGGQTVLGQPAVCDVGNGKCRPDTTGNGFTPVLPSQVHLDPTKRYYISVLPGDAANPFYGATATGHGMGGAPIPGPCAIGTTATTCTTAFAPVNVVSQPSPYPPARLSVFVFEDDFPLNGEQDGGGGIDVLSPIEPGLGGFQIHLWDAMGGNGDFTGQMTYDMFNQPLTNSLDGTIDPLTGNNACPVSQAGVSNPGTNATTGPLGSSADAGTVANTGGITGMIVTCPKYEADGKTLSPLAGQAVVSNLMPGRWGVIATPGADRIARGEEWLQTNTLDGQKAHDSFTRIGEPSYFQEFGPAGFHVSIGFANPGIINGRKPYLCNGSDPNSPQPSVPYSCGNTLTGKVTGEHLSRTPDERLYSSGSHDTFYWTQCFVSFGDADGEDFAFTKCAADGTFTLTGLPDGDWRITTFDQWNDQLVDGLSTPVRLGSATSICPGTGSSTHVCNMGDIAATQWQTNLYTRTFVDDNKDGISQSTEAGIPLLNVAVRLRDGSLENLLVTDFTGTANFNETFPLFSWYTVETDVPRYKNTGTHVVYDVGGPTDGSAACGVTGYPPCGTSTIGKTLANTAEIVSVPSNLRVPGAVYCKDADCSTHTTGILGGSASSDPPSACTTANTAPYATTCTTQLSSGRIDPPFIGGVEGWQGFPGQNNFIEFGKEPYAPGETGGIHGHVEYASTRPFDDPQMLVQTQWTPMVPHVGINLYQEGFAADGVTPTLTLVDHTQTSSWDDWAQGFRMNNGVLVTDPVSGAPIPNMSCPGQGTAMTTAGTNPIPDLFFFSLYDQPSYLDFYNNVEHGTATAPLSLPYNSQFKCYDGMHNWNQIQPAPYDGAYQFPSVTSLDPTTGKPNGTNCLSTVCLPNHTVPATDLYYGLPMLPPGKYVVEVVVPPGFELVKEEDKNILIGDNFIAPAAQQFGGLGNVFIVPDQATVSASIASGCVPTSTYACNPQQTTQSLGASPNNGIVPGFVPEPTWPCVGEARIVPDYISLYPYSKQMSPFAGATRNLCDRKEVTLTEQMGAIAKFYIFTSTHIASKFTGGITDDYTSEFDPFSPQFGEKFAPPDLPVSFKDWTGNEVSRVYADHWGAYNGMTYSTWEVNPPNPTGYSPTMMVVCMNDPGPIPGPSGSLITDPAFTQGYSQFCYELPFMPGTTQYLDTPVVPTSAFAGAGYNNVDCYYPSHTPAIKEVDSSDGVGPWVSGSGSTHTLTITALGDQMVPNHAYSGPAATGAPYNQKTVLRHYGFGSSGTVTIGGVTAAVGTWNDNQITVTVPAGVPACPIQQQGQSTALCGQLVITTANTAGANLPSNAMQSIDTVTVTIGGKAPTHVAASAMIQPAIDAAQPGDLIIIDPTCPAACTTDVVTSTTVGPVTTVTSNTTAAHSELLLMWKPVRLQGVGAASSILNANTHPAGKLDAWRREVNCLFGLALDGQPISGTNAYDSTGSYTCTAAMQGAVDRLPLEATVGWDASLNGNLAELLQEPSLMGALEGAGITVLAKGVDFHGANQYDPTLLGGFPTATTLLTAKTCGPTTTTNTFYPSSFWCNPSSIDGLGITNSSQGGGGIFVHGWGHNLQIANNRIYNNAGTLSGGINLGQGEFPPSYIQGSATNAAPGSCQTSSITNAQLPYCHNLNVNIHHNSISLNSSTGDELFSATPAGAGGVSVCTGSDYYKFNYNWLCGNLSSGDGGGFGHLGYSWNGDIEHNTIIFNQSLNPTIPANGGGLIIMGAPDADPPCGVQVDTDCVPAPNSIGPSDGIGNSLTINANLIMGNAAEAGTGGGMSLQNVNGSDVIAFPRTPANWNYVNITNNIITNNVAGWDGAGVSLQEALNTDIVNNTIADNDSTASAGVLFTTIGAPLASQHGKNCIAGGTNSCPQVAGLVSVPNDSVLKANLPATITCPPNHGPVSPTNSSRNNGACRYFAYPLLTGNIIYNNRSFQIGVGALSNAVQQNIITLYNANFTGSAHGTAINSQGATGACVAGSSYWDLGVRGDTGPANHTGSTTTGTTTVPLNPVYSVLTSTSGYASSNIAGSPNFVLPYCNGSRTPPEFGGTGFAVPPGISDATVPNPIFNLTPVATVDEGNNWVNLRWGPLSMLNTATSTSTTNVVLGNYALAGASGSAYDHVPTSQPHPTTDFFGNARPETAADGHLDAGAVEFGSVPPTPILAVTPSPLAFGNVVTGTTATGTLTLSNTGLAQATGITVAFGGSVAFAPAGGTCGATLASGATCTINATFSPGTTVGAQTGTVTITANVAVTGSPVTLSGTGVAAVRAATLTPTTWTVSQTRNCPGTTLLQILACTLDPGRVFTLTNTGNVTLTGIAQGALGGTAANVANYTVVRLLSTCGPAGNGQVLGTTTLAPGASCVVTVQFKPLTAQPVGLKPATISVTDAAGTQTSTLNGTAN